MAVYTQHTIGTLSDLAKSCAAIHQQGFATDDAEYREGLRCVAAPIRAQKGMVVGSIGISAPAERFSMDQYAECGEQVRGIADEISARLQFIGLPTELISTGDSPTVTSNLLPLRAPLDAFFDKVTVNAAEPDLRRNRLRLVHKVRARMDRIADFSKIEG